MISCEDFIKSSRLAILETQCNAFFFFIDNWDSKLQN